MVFGSREKNRERGALPLRAFTFELAAVFAGDLLDKRQSQPGAAVFGGEEGHEHLFELFLAHAFAGVVTRRRICPPSRQVPTVNSPPSGMASRLLRIRFSVACHNCSASAWMVPASGSRCGVAFHPGAARKCRSMKCQFLDEEFIQFHGTQLRFRQPGELQIILQDILDALDFIAYFRRRAGALSPGGLPASPGSAADFLLEQVQVQGDGAERIADLMGDLGGHRADHGEPFRLDFGHFQPFAFLNFRLQCRRSLFTVCFQMKVSLLKRRDQTNHEQEKNQKHQRVPNRRQGVMIKVT